MPSQNGKVRNLQSIRERPAERPWWADDGYMPTHQIEWEEVPGEALVAFVASCTQRGALVMFAQTGDGTAIKVGIKDGPKPVWWYPSDADDLTTLLRRIARAAAGSPEDRSTQS